MAAYKKFSCLTLQCSKYFVQLIFTASCATTKISRQQKFLILWYTICTCNELVGVAQGIVIFAECLLLVINYTPSTQPTVNCVVCLALWHTWIPVLFNTSLKDDACVWYSVASVRIRIVMCQALLEWAVCILCLLPATSATSISRTAGARSWTSQRRREWRLAEAKTHHPRLGLGRRQTPWPEDPIEGRQRESGEEGTVRRWLYELFFVLL